MPLSYIDDSFGFTNDFFGNLYIFNDAAINGHMHTFHLNIDPNAPFTFYNSDMSITKSYRFAKAYQVELLRLTPEYFEFFNALNNADNNELAKIGLSLTRPLPSNITNGLGMLG